MCIRDRVRRQPKRKEEIISPVWGRLIYSYEFENDYCPAIILDAIDAVSYTHLDVYKRQVQ